jgi:hypothetical protein
VPFALDILPFIFSIDRTFYPLNEWRAAYEEEIGRFYLFRDLGPRRSEKFSSGRGLDRLPTGVCGMRGRCWMIPTILSTNRQHLFDSKLRLEEIEDVSGLCRAVLCFACSIGADGNNKLLGRFALEPILGLQLIWRWTKVEQFS